jgi:thioredoxin-dependent peroxiredoxin
LGRLDKRLAELEKTGATIVALSVDKVDRSQALVKRLGLHFPILSDPTGDMIRSYGVWHAANRIALPAIFVIAPDGRIAWRKVAETVIDRPTEDEILDALGKIRTR